MSNSYDNISNQGSEPEVKEQDKLLPIANITRIMKCAIPDNSKISKEAKDAVQESVSEFIMFISSEASDRCKQEKRKTINAEDLIWAMQNLGFDSYVNPLQMYLAKIRGINKSEKNNANASSSRQILQPALQQDIGFQGAANNHAMYFQ